MQEVPYATTPIDTVAREGPTAEQVLQEIEQQHPMVTYVTSDQEDEELAAALDPLIFEGLVRP